MTRAAHFCRAFFGYALVMLWPPRLTAMNRWYSIPYWWALPYAGDWAYWGDEP